MSQTHTTRRTFLRTSAGLLAGGPVVAVRDGQDEGCQFLDVALAGADELPG